MSNEGRGRIVQGTVASFDHDDRTGTVLLDDGAPIAFPADAFEASGLRLLRLGQRVRIEYDPAGKIALVTLVTLH
jgi:2-phospho-L-lactate guanylyltransferase